jgi:hypothetical protein
MRVLMTILQTEITEVCNEVAFSRFELSFQALWFPLPVIILLMCLTHLSSDGRTVSSLGPKCLSLTPPPPV